MSNTKFLWLSLFAFPLASLSFVTAMECEQGGSSGSSTTSLAGQGEGKYEQMGSSLSSAVSIPSNVQKWYEEAIECSKDAFENGKLKKSVRLEELTPHSLYLLINAYKEGHEQSTEILRQITFLKLVGKIKKKKRGPFPIKERATLEDYDRLSKKQQENVLSECLNIGLNALFPDFEKQEEAKYVAVQEYWDREAEIEADLSKIRKELKKVEEKIKRAAEQQVATRKKAFLHKRRKELKKKQVGLIQAQVANEDMVGIKVYGELPSTKRELFEQRVSDKLTAILISKIAIAEGTAQRNPDLVNKGFDVTRAAVGLGLSFAPYFGSAIAAGFNLSTSLGEAGYNVYQKRKTIKYATRLLGNDDVTQKVLRLCNNLVPETAKSLAKRYNNPLKLYETNAKNIEKLADYATKLMVNNSGNHSSEIPNSSKEIANFLCDGVSYYDQKAGCMASGKTFLEKLSPSKRQFHHILTDSGVVTKTSPRAFYFKIKDNQTASDKLIEKYGFRREDKTADVLQGYDLYPLEGESRSKAKDLIKKGKKDEQEFNIQKSNGKSSEKRVVKEFFKENIEIIIDELPLIAESILAGINS